MDLVKAFLLSTVFVLLVSMVSGNHGPAEDIVEAKCDAGADVVDAPHEVTLDGEKVDVVECSNVEAYSFPDSRAVEMPTVRSGPSVQEFVLSVLLPPLVMFSSAVIVSWRTGLGWKRPSLFFLGAVVSFIAESGLLWVMEVLNLDYSILSLSIPVLLGLFTLPAYLLYTGDLDSRETRSSATVSFLFIAAINWLIIVFIFLAQSSLNAFIA